jgi:hypothetical protein
MTSASRLGFGNTHAHHPGSSMDSMSNSHRMLMHGYPLPNYPTPHPNPVPMIPDSPPYSLQPRYHPGYIVSRSPSGHAMPAVVRSMPTHPSPNDWNNPMMMSANVGDPQSFVRRLPAQVICDRLTDIQYHPVDTNLLASHHVHHGRHQ